MSIHMRSLSPETYHAMQQLSEARGWAPVFEYMESEAVAWLTFLLSEVPDDEDIFPRGKWATIQRLHGMVSVAAKKQLLAERAK